MFKHFWHRIKKTDEDSKLEVKKVEASENKPKRVRCHLPVKKLDELNVKFLRRISELDELLRTALEIDEQQIHLLRTDCINVIEKFEKIYFENKDICDEVGIDEIIERQVQSFNHFESIIKRVVERAQVVKNEVIYLNLFQFYSDYKKLNDVLEKLLAGKK